ncbi:MAG: aminodeoxychorismate lyase, partial [Betaproteobacteria bacterium]
MRAVTRALLGLLLAAMALAGAAAWWISRPLDLGIPVVELSVEPGMTPREVALGWVAAGLETSPDLLYEWFRWSGHARRIRAGSYEVHAGVTPRTLLDKLVQGDE